MSKSPPKNPLFRSQKLVAAIGRYALSEVRRKANLDGNTLVSKDFRRQALKLIESLDHLKGFPLKFGQLLSLDTAGILPEEVRLLFERLQNQATPVDHKVMRHVFECELGEGVKDLKVDWNPLASASLGQVYSAELGQQELVVKIQYPDIDKSLDGDLLVLKRIVPLLSRMAANPSLEERYNVAHSCLELFCRELFDWGIVQTDPNFANFLVLDNGKIGLLDFGATIEYEPDFVDRYRSLLNALHEGKENDVLRLSIEFELLDARESGDAKKSYLEMVKVSVAPFLLKGKFDFSNQSHIQLTKDTSIEFLRHARYTPPPRHLIFLHRKLGGLYSLLSKLNVQIDLRPYWEKWIRINLIVIVGL